MNTMLKKISILAILFGFFAGSGLTAQDGTPVLDPFSGSTLIDTRTNQTAYKGTWEFLIQHRFGKIQELSDLYGLYAPSNIYLGFYYGITDDITIGFGSEKNNKLQSFEGKWQVLKQTESYSMPVGVTLYGNMAIDAREEAAFGKDYAFTDRLSYFGQVILTHKFNDRFSLLVAPAFSHVNAADSLINHDNISLTVGGRAKVYNDIAVIAEYGHPFDIEGMTEYAEPIVPKPNLAFGVEFVTMTHVFQVYASPFRGIVPQQNYLFNANDFTEGDIMLGFNIKIRLF